MKTIRKISSNPFFIFAILVSFMAQASTHTINLVTAKANQKPIVAQFTGEELFKSIFFMDGTATGLFPVLNENFKPLEQLKTPEEMAAYKTVQTNAIAFIKKSSPTFFTTLQKDLYSQDPVTIKKAITNAANALVPYLDSEAKKQGVKYNITNLTAADKAELAKIKDDYKKGTATMMCCVLAIAIVLVAAVAFYVVLISEFAVGVYDGSGSNFFLDELSLSVSKNLK